jgi:hypothetical protein
MPSPNASVTPLVVATPTPTPSPPVQNALQPSATVDSNDVGKSVPDVTTSDQDALILRILKAMETHDYRTVLIYTVDKETDYFGHKNSSSAFIQQDMTQDARSYKWCRFVPDLSTFETSLGHDSIEYDRMHSMFEAKSIRRDVVLTFITRLQLHPDCRRCP